MVSKGQIGIGAVIVMCAVAAGAMLYPTTNTMPGADVAFDVEDIPSMVAKSLSTPALHTLISYHDIKIYERTEFKVEVTDSFSNPIEGANVSFMKPGIYGHTDSEGSVFFTAPFISNASAPHLRIEYIASPGDTSCTFPITVTKEGYEEYWTDIRVYIRPDA